MPFIPALIGVAGAIGGAVISGNASRSASKTAANAAAANNALQQQTYDSNKALIQPGVDRGNQAADELQGFLGLGGDPEKTKAAFNTYLGSTGYQFERDQGLAAVGQQANAMGLYNSGAAEKALQDRGTSLANTYGQQYVGNLNDVANRGTNSINALTGAATANANAQGSNNAGAANVAANATISGAASTNGLINSAINAFGVTRGQTSYGGGGTSAGGGNAFNQPGFKPFAYTGG